MKGHEVLIKGEMSFGYFFELFYLNGIPSLKIKFSPMKDVIMNKIHKSFLGFKIDASLQVVEVQMDKY